MKIQLQNCVIIAAATCLLLSNSASAQLIGDPRGPSTRFSDVTDPIAEFWLGQASRTLAAERGKVSQDISDRAFNVYVRPALIGQAYAASDSSLLTDVALQLAEGERVLLRSRNGITAAQALQLAVNAASQKQDKGSLQRLAKFAESRGDKQLAGQVAAAEKLAAVSRDTTYRMMVPIEEIEVDDYTRLRYCVQRIDQARLTGDSRCLMALEEDIQSCVLDAFRSNLAKMIADARAAIPKTQEVDEQLIGTLSRLVAMSRPDYDDSPPSDPQNISGAF